ncbi:MAG TPA: LLM class flavin-dependent oxidoreductase [Candidatus Limnocylindrales bacterium]|nr:LLM class flavin-dependent oxidoreductase [Candidatus Limnocylindrales bacterium]
MRFGAAYWVQRTGWPDLRRSVLHAEACGFDDLWIDDHLLSDEGAWQDPKLEGWSTLAAIAGLTTRPRLGLMVAANTFRNPGLTAKLATTLDHLSDGRAILGIGAGWFAREHEAFGLEFGAGFGERLDRLAEAVPLVRRLLDGERVTHDGRFYRFEDAICAPRPIQPHLPILIGGSGPTKTLPLIARSGDLWNAYGRPDELAASDAILRAACDAVGRDQREIERTFNANVVIRATREEAERAWRRWVDAHLPQAGEDRLSAFGTVADVAEALDAYRAVGFEHPVLIFRTPFDHETMDRLPELRAALGS